MEQLEAIVISQDDLEPIEEGDMILEGDIMITQHGVYLVMEWDEMNMKMSLCKYQEPIDE